MTVIFGALVSDGLRPHVAWRVAFAIIPVPCILLIVAAILIFGTDHPAGKWSERNNLPGAAAATQRHSDSFHEHSSGSEADHIKSEKKEQATVAVNAVEGGASTSRRLLRYFASAHWPIKL
jgi:MFS transporter, NNP family, nitrate/nitrite transporter